MGDMRIPWAWLAMAAFVVAGSGVPEVAELIRWTMVLAVLYLLLVNYPKLNEPFMGGASLMDRFLGGLR